MTAPLPKKPWKPRSSSIGMYLQCEWRGLQDRLFHEGRLPEHDREPFDSPNASLGNCGHFTLQDGLRCQFSPRDHDFFNAERLLAENIEFNHEEKEFLEYAETFFEGDIDATIAAYKAGDPRIYQPLPSEWIDASQLFAGDIEITREKVRATASLAASRVPKSPDGKPWLCETLLENDYLTGHTDFLSQDYTVVGDLKTTAQPPNHGWIKYEHLGQLAAYHLLTGCKTSWVLYVDSMRASWVTVVWVDWSKPGLQRYAEQVKDFCKHLMSDAIFDSAVPRLGSHCSKTWCSYRKTCYQEMMPAAGTVFDAAASKRPTGQLQWGVPT